MSRIAGTTIACLLLFLAAANADVVVERKISFQMMGMPEMEMTSTEQIQEDKSCGRTEFSGGSMMGMAAGAQQAEINITRLDKGVMWNLNESSRKYSEHDLSAMKDDMNAAAGEPDKSDKYEWTVDIEKPEPTEINGIPCTGIIAVATGVHKENPEEKVVLTMEQWVSDEVPGQETLEAFEENYATATGMSRQSRERIVKKLGTKFGSAFDKLMEGTKELEGIPIKMVITGKTTAEVPSMPGMSEEDMKNMDPEAAAMMKKFMPEKTKESEGGMNTLFSVTTEITGITTEDVDDSVFEIPEGYTKR